MSNAANGRRADHDASTMTSAIARISATPVNVPMVAPYRFAFGRMKSFTTTIIEVEDADGVVGVGESPHGDLSGSVERLTERLLGRRVDDLNGLEALSLPGHGFSLWVGGTDDRRAFGGIEIALFDLRARRQNRPLVEILGGRVRKEVAFTEYFALREGAEETPSQVIDYCVRMASEHGSPWFEGKLGVLDVETEMRMIADLVSALGPGMVTRLDANGAYTVPTARQVIPRLAEQGIGWLEDPCRSLDEMAILRADGVPISFSTHEVDFTRAARGGVPDGFCLDIAELGGIRRTQDFLRACALIGTDFWCYSGDAGIMTAAYLHLTASEPSMIRPHQSLFRFTGDVAIEQGHYSPTAGLLPVPDGPGLGVTIDRSALARMHDRYRSEGSMGSGYGEGYRRW
jgi:glucarate dehydratase